MNIYKKDNEILASLNGCPEGWTNLGFDESITEDNKNFVTGFSKNKAVFDTNKMSEYEAIKAAQIKLNANRSILSQLDTIDRKSIRAIREGNQTRINELESQAVALRGQLV